MQAILRDEVDEVQTAIFLIALRMKRESLEEFLGVFAALQAEVDSTIAQLDDVVCLADPFDGYLRNATMTPFIPFVLAANEVNAVMHGVESVGPKHGVTAHKVYKLAGANTALTTQAAAAQLEAVGACYVDQSRYAPGLFGLQDLRDRMVKRSALTTLERLLIPIKGLKTTRLALGYVHKAYPDIYARVAFSAGYDSVLLLKGVEGGLAPALNKPLRRFVFDKCLPDDVDAAKQVFDTPFSSPDQSFSDIASSSNAGGEKLSSAAAPMQPGIDSVEQCLDQGLSVLNGAGGLARDSLVLATAQMLNSFKPNLGFIAAVEKVQACLDNGSALERFNAFVA